MHSRTQVLITAGSALLAAAVVPVTVLPALAVPTGPPPAAEATPGRAAPGPAAPGRAAPVPSAVRPPVREDPPVRAGAAGPPPAEEPAPTAAALLARAGGAGCNQVSDGLYRTRDDTPPTVAVCDANGAVFFDADMDIDCDGEPTARCNRASDPYFQEQTAFTRSDGRYLTAEHLPYIVIPMASGIWDHRASGIHGGSVAAVIHRNTVQYAVVGDIGPPGIIGEASLATARGLGILTDPAGGGVPSGVTYIVFKHSQVSPLEDHEAAVRLGTELARKFLSEN
ncbi:glycoside hydrolase family 75 protein [Streptomyces sp. NPDC093085]|uniref:glycoside hydrolase family 75 protein n=1 Tax=Streptomyces sp. NPDC093085 TaxID=3155068 RepID=UPI003412DA05